MAAMPTRFRTSVDRSSTVSFTVLYPFLTPLSPPVVKLIILLFPRAPSPRPAQALFRSHWHCHHITFPLFFFLHAFHLPAQALARTHAPTHAAPPGPSSSPQYVMLCLYIIFIIIIKRYCKVARFRVRFRVGNSGHVSDNLQKKKKKLWRR
jgi:hypothetical protein